MTFIIPQTNNPGWKICHMEYDLSLHSQTNICSVNLDLYASDKLRISEAERKTG